MHRDNPEPLGGERHTTVMHRATQIGIAASRSRYGRTVTQVEILR